MPTVTAGEIVRRVQSLGGDPGGTFVTQTDVWDWIMDAQHEISKITECLTSTQLISSVANQEMYTLSDVVLKPLRVTYNNVLLRHTSIEILDEIDPSRDASGNAGVPTFYFMDGGQLGLWPKPESSVSNIISMRARILASTAITADANVLQIPDYFRENVVRYCMLKMREKDEQPEIWQVLMGDWIAKLGIAKDIANNPNANAYPSVRDVESMLDFYPEWYGA